MASSVKHPGVFMTIVFVQVRNYNQTFTFNGEIDFEEAAQRARLSMTLGDVKQIEDIFVTHVKDMTKPPKPVLGWGS